MAIALSLPVFAYAEGINSITEASSDTGGSVTGGTTTSGDSSASVYVRNMFGTQGTTSRVEINVKTETDGVIQMSSVKKNIEGAGHDLGVAGVSVKIATSSKGSLVQVSAPENDGEDMSEKKFFTFESFRALFRSFFGFFRFF